MSLLSLNSTSQAQSMENAKSEARLKAISMAFRVGGYITVREADDFLRLRHGTTKEAVDAGNITAVTRKFGTKIRTVVLARDVETFFGIKK